MINLNKKFLGFVNNDNRNNSDLYIFKNLNELHKNKTLNNDHKKYFSSKKNGEVIFLPNVNKSTLTAITLVNPSIIHRESTIDQAAKVSSQIEKKIWNIYFSKSYSINDIYDFFLGWGLSFYNFSLKAKVDKNKAINLRSLKIFPKQYLDQCKNEILGIFLARDLINLPANFLNPEEYEKKVIEIFRKKNSDIKVFKGGKFRQMFPLIHLVGRASEYSPRLIEVKWENKSNKNNPLITIIGKGITFDSGGLDIKPSSSMLMMKKDMAGSAIAISLAKTIISENYNLNLRLLLPIAENSVSEKSMRPMDIVYSRNKTPVEIGNTDAEGRLILADALTYAQEDKNLPDLIIDLSTLTGAARIALGTEMPAFFSNNRKISQKLAQNSLDYVDPLWELPLFSSYNRHLQNDNGSLSSTGFVRTGGAITAALFLQKFIRKNVNWIHLDLMGWNVEGRPGFPKGGEAMSFRAVLKTINDLYSKSN